MSMKKFNKKKSNLLIIVIALLSLGIIGVSVSILMRKSTKSNHFVTGTVTPKIKETFGSGVKEDVYVKNEGNSPIYIRILINYNFVDSEGKILFETPILNNDYTITYSNSDKWILSKEGYYYYKNLLEPNEETDILIDRIEEIGHDINKLLDVNILVQSIQASPDSAVSEAWNVNINDGVLSLRN